MHGGSHGQVGENSRWGVRIDPAEARGASQRRLSAPSEAGGLELRMLDPLAAQAEEEIMEGPTPPRSNAAHP
eukprot:3799562-Pyramimonas_sp.AAC.1